MAFGFLSLIALEPDASSGFGLETLVKAGAKVNERVDSGELYRLIAAGFLHVNTIHFFINAVALVICGALFWRTASTEQQNSERALAMFGLALATSAAGFFASYLVGNGPSCGASAATFGLLGGAAGSTYTVPLGQTTSRWGRAFPGAILTIVGFGLLLALLSTPGVDHAAHLGGYLSGLAWGAASNRRAGRLSLAITTFVFSALALATL